MEKIIYTKYLIMRCTIIIIIIWLIMCFQLCVFIGVLLFILNLNYDYEFKFTKKNTLES